MNKVVNRFVEEVIIDQDELLTPEEGVWKITVWDVSIIEYEINNSLLVMHLIISFKVVLWADKVPSSLVASVKESSANVTGRLWAHKTRERKEQHIWHFFRWAPNVEDGCWDSYKSFLTDERPKGNLSCTKMAGKARWRPRCCRHLCCQRVMTA